MSLVIKNKKILPCECVTTGTLKVNIFKSGEIWCKLCDNSRLLCYCDVCCLYTYYTDSWDGIDEFTICEICGSD